jgi:hypothetical protein
MERVSSTFHPVNTRLSNMEKRRARPGLVGEQTKSLRRASGAAGFSMVGLNRR